MDSIATTEHLQSVRNLIEEVKSLRPIEQNAVDRLMIEYLHLANVPSVKLGAHDWSMMYYLPPQSVQLLREFVERAVSTRLPDKPESMNKPVTHNRARKNLARGVGSTLGLIAVAGVAVMLLRK